MAAHVQAADVWIQVTSKNFVLMGDAGESEIRLAAAKLEQFRETLRTLFPQFGSDSGVPAKVIVFKDAASYAPFKPRRPDGSIDDAVNGYFQAGEGVNYITLAISDKPGAYTTIFHEYVHFLLDAHIGRSDLPPWLNEGLAEYLETLQISPDGVVTLGTPPAGHIDLLRKEPLIPLKDLVSTDNTSLHGTGDRTRSFFYSQAWLLTHYFLQTVDVRGQDRFDQIVSLMRSKSSKADDLTKLLDTDEPGLMVELKKYVDRPPQTRSIKIRTKGSLIEMRASPLSASQSLAVLGDLLYHAGRLADAEVLLRKALVSDPASSLANMSLGLILAQRNDLTQARIHLERAIRSDRSNYYAYFNYAYAISRESADEYGNVTSFPVEASAKMTDALEQAIKLKPEFTESYRLLALVKMVGDTDLDASVELLIKGLSYRPGDESLRLLLAQVYLRQEKYPEVKKLAESIAGSASNEKVWASTQSLLHTVNEYYAAKAAGESGKDEGRAFGKLPPLILKRSTLSETDVSRIEEDRMIFNLNLLIDRPRFSEKQFVGFVDKIVCSNGEINFNVRTLDDTFQLLSDTFSGIKMGVLTEGERSFTIDCGVRLGKQLAVITYRPSLNTKPAVRGRLVSIWFVPDYFRIKTSEEMAARRTVIIEDDRLFKPTKSNVSGPN